MLNTCKVLGVSLTPDQKKHVETNVRNSFFIMSCWMKRKLLSSWSLIAKIIYSDLQQQCLMLCLDFCIGALWPIEVVSQILPPNSKDRNQRWANCWVLQCLCLAIWLYWRHLCSLKHKKYAKTCFIAVQKLLVAVIKSYHNNLLR